MNSTIALTFGALRSVNLLAASDLTGQMSKVAGILNTVAVVLVFFGLVLAGVFYMMGRTEYMKYGLVGAAIGGLSWPLTKFLFESGSGETINVELDHSF